MGQPLHLSELDTLASAGARLLEAGTAEAAASITASAACDLLTAPAAAVFLRALGRHLELGRSGLVSVAIDQSVFAEAAHAVDGLARRMVLATAMPDVPDVRIGAATLSADTTPLTALESARSAIEQPHQDPR